MGEPPRPVGPGRGGVSVAGVGAVGAAAGRPGSAAQQLDDQLRGHRQRDILRAGQAGFAIQWVPLAMIVMSLTYSLSAYPAGILSDRVNRRYLLAAGMVLLLVADLVLALAGSPSIVLVGVALWGLHMGCTQGILAAMIAEVTRPELKGTAFGLFNLASGLCMLLASLIAGGLWETYGPAITFYVGAGFSLSALVLLISLAQSRVIAAR